MMLVSEDKQKSMGKRERFIIPAFKKSTIFCALTMLSFLVSTPAEKANAFGPCSGCGQSTALRDINNTVHDGVDEIKKHIDEEFEDHQDYLVNDFYEDQVKPALQTMTKQFTAIAMHQVMIIGTFFDAKQQLETERLYQTLQVQAHKDYQPSEDFCYFGTNVRSLAASEQIGNITRTSLANRQLQRQLGKEYASSENGPRYDKEMRWRQFRRTYCGEYDNGAEIGKSTTGLQEVCEAVSDKKRINIDIDYGRLIDQPRTLDVAFHDGTSATDQETDIMALSSNLFGHNILERKYKPSDLAEDVDNQKDYFQLRSIAAKRAVAEHSFNSIVALKAEGSYDDGASPPVNTREFLAAVIENLGITDPQEIYEYIGDNPSYYAQLEILAKKIYQSPDFFVGLYDKPANVERKSAALKAIELMIDREIYNSQLRQEMSLSTLLSTNLHSDLVEVDAKLGGE